MELIDKAPVKAEIERRISLLKKEKKIEKWSAGASQMNVVSLGARIAMLEEILSYINTLEMEEVDVEKESELIANGIMISVQANLYHTNVYDYEKRCYKHSDLKDAARKGIELSLKTQKGE